MTVPAPAPVPATKGKRKEVITSPRFWAATAERAFLTFFQSFGAELVVFNIADVEELGLHGLPWHNMLAVAAFASLTSFVTSVGKVAGGAEGPGLTERLKKRKPAQPASEESTDFPTENAAITTE